MQTLSLLDYLKGRLAAKLPEGLRPAGWQPVDDETAAALWEEARRAVAAETAARKATPAAAPTLPPGGEAAPAPAQPPAPVAAPAASASARLAQRERGTAAARRRIPRTRWPRAQGPLPWAALLALGMALLAQAALEPKPYIPRHWTRGVMLYAPALALWLWALLKHRAAGSPHDDAWAGEQDGRIPLRPVYLAAAALFSIGAFLGASDNRFTVWGVALWGLAIVAVAAAFARPPRWRAWWARWRQGRWPIEVRPWHVALLLVAAVAVYFHFVHLQSVGGEMISDHADKLLDVAAVLNGKTTIFFQRNTGREPLDVYFIACLIKCFGLGFDFLTLKLSMTLFGLLMLPFVYLLGKEIGGRWAGLWATLFVGFAYWPNALVRSGLRLTLAPAFAAPTLYFFLRALKYGRRNDYLWAGLFLGAGMYGFSAFRIMPLALLTAWALYVGYHKSRGQRYRATVGLALAALVAFVVFIPLLRYISQDAHMFFFRTATRLGQAERPYPGNPVVIFFDNLLKALVMPFWDDGEIWVHSIPHRPALDWLSAALYGLGLVAVLVRWWQRRSWEDAFLLLSIPILLLPSALSLAFPHENPCLSRTAAAYVPIFVVVGLAAATLQQSLARWRPMAGRWAGLALIALLALMAAQANSRLIFRDFARQYHTNAWNASAMGRVVHGFVALGNDPHSAWLVNYPYWVDSRLVAIEAGRFPQTVDLGLPPDKLETTLDAYAPKLFLLNPQDHESLLVLHTLYPHAQQRVYHSPWRGKDFIIYYVP